MDEEPWDHIQNANIQLEQYTIGQWQNIMTHVTAKTPTYQDLMHAVIKAGYGNLPANYLNNTLNAIAQTQEREKNR